MRPTGHLSSIDCPHFFTSETTQRSTERNGNEPAFIYRLSRTPHSAARGDRATSRRGLSSAGRLPRLSSETDKRRPAVDRTALQSAHVICAPSSASRLSARFLEPLGHCVRELHTSDAPQHGRATLRRRAANGVLRLLRRRSAPPRRCRRCCRRCGAFFGVITAT